MRRAAAWAGVVVATAAVAALGFAPWPLSARRVAERLNAAFGASAGVHWNAPESAIFQALPWPTLTIVNARLDSAVGVNLVTAPKARMDLSFGELIKGRFAPVRAVLVTPIMMLDLDRPPLIRQGAMPDDAGALAPLRSLSLSNGVLRIVCQSRGLDTVMENVEGRLEGLAPGDRMRMNIVALWRDAPIAISGELDNLELAARGEPSAFELALASPIASLSFRGALVGGEEPSVTGEVSGSIPTLKALTRLVGLDLPRFVAADDVSATGRITANLDEATFAEATVTTAQQTLQGALKVTGLKGRPVLSGSFATERLAIAPLVGAAPPLFDGDGSWSARSFVVKPTLDFDLDLRFSAGHLDVYGRELADAAASVILKDGVLTASLVDAAAYGGRLRGEARVACLGDDINVRASAKLADADIGAAASDFGWSVPTGLGALEFALETIGRSPAAAVAGLGGSASIHLEQGSLSGLNLEEALRRSQRRPIDVARDMRVGGTTFDTVDLEFALGGGIVHIVKGELAAHAVAADLQGQIDLPAQSWALRVNAMQTDGVGREPPDAAHLRFDIEGPWSAPAIRATSEPDWDKTGPSAR
jgi:AsmA protein